MFKKQKGITLIALVITIIVLLILAGVTIAAITSNESAPKKAVQARTENDRGAARDAATLLVAEKTQEYYEKKYVSGGTNAATPGAYANTVLATAVTRGDLTIKVDGGKLQVTKGSDTTPLVTGTITPEGTITWSDGTASGGTGSTGGPTIVGDENPVYGETVEYDPGELTTASIDLPEGASIEGAKLASVSLPDGASLDSTIDASKATEWKVLRTTESGDVLIIPTTYDTTTLYLDGMDGYNNAEDALDAVAQIYINPEYAKSARSIRVEDVYTAEEFEPTDTNVNATASQGDYTYSWDHRYGMNAENLKIIDYGQTDGEDNVANRTYKSTPATEAYSYSFEGSNPLGSDISHCWLASRCVALDSNGCFFHVRYLDSGYLYSVSLFSVDAYGYAGSSSSYSVLPVVTLKSGITMQKDSNGVWKLTK